MKDDVTGEEGRCDVYSSSLEGEDVGCDDDLEAGKLLLVLAWHFTVMMIGVGMARDALKSVM